MEVEDILLHLKYDHKIEVQFDLKKYLADEKISYVLGVSQKVIDENLQRMRLIVSNDQESSSESENSGIEDEKFDEIT